MSVLLTGFEPFARWRVNSSGEAVRALGDAPGRVARVLPVDHEAASAALRALLAETRAEVALLTGLAAGPTPRLELRARRPVHRPPEGPEALPGLWSWAASLDAMRRAGAPARLSADAGRYVCETTYRAALEARAERSGPRLVAFLHLPPLSEDWPLERVTAAVSACLASGLQAAGLDKPPAAP